MPNRAPKERLVFIAFRVSSAASYERWLKDQKCKTFETLKAAHNFCDCEDSHPEGLKVPVPDFFEYVGVGEGHVCNVGHCELWVLLRAEKIISFLLKVLDNLKYWGLGREAPQWGLGSRSP